MRSRSPALRSPMGNARAPVGRSRVVRSMARFPARVILLAAALCPLAAPMRGAAALATTPAAPSSLDWKEKVLRMTDFLDTMLPGTLAHESIVVEFAPKFSDLRDY